jgi:hypothetical protein
MVPALGVLVLPVVRQLFLRKRQPPLDHFNNLKIAADTHTRPPSCRPRNQHVKHSVEKLRLRRPAFRPQLDSHMTDALACSSIILVVSVSSSRCACMLASSTLELAAEAAQV